MTRIFFSIIIMITMFISGCAIGTTRLQVHHAPIDKIEPARQGNLLVTKFVDKRKEADLEQIGNKRNGFGMVLGHVAVEEGIKLDELLTKYFSEALNAAGYTTVIQKSDSAADSVSGKFDAIITGEITEFWMDLYMKVWHKVGINAKALDPDTRSIVWQKNIEASESNVLWVGATGEYERVVDAALTKALNQAARDFSSDEFYRAITSNK